MESHEESKHFLQSNLTKVLSELKDISSCLKQIQQTDLSVRIDNIIYLIDDLDSTTDTHSLSETKEKDPYLISFLSSFSKKESNLNMNSTQQILSKRFSVKKQVEKEVETEEGNETAGRIRKTSYYLLSNLLKVREKLTNISNFDFNIFELEALVKDKTLMTVSNAVFKRMDMFSSDLINENMLLDFVKEISNGYSSSVPYHNQVHAADVLQTCYVFINKGSFYEDLELTPLDIMSLFVACICHDYKHDGYNNMFHYNKLTDIAIDSNDSSILESFHARESYKVIQKLDLLRQLDSISLRHFRKRFLEAILSTDMTYHSSHISSLINKINIYNVNLTCLNRLLNNEGKVFESQQQILNMIIHSSDISNPAKPYIVYSKWVNFVFEEFFNQGDVEIKLGLDVSILCDRQRTSIPRSQVNFINYIVFPTFELMNRIVDIKEYIENIKLNLSIYQLKDEEERNGKD